MKFVTLIALLTSAVSFAQFNPGLPQPVRQATNPWVVSGGVTITGTPYVAITGTASVVFGGKNLVTSVRNDYLTNPVTTGAYVTLVASTSAAVNQMELFDSSGRTLQLAFGAPGSEVNQALVYPGGNGSIPLLAPAGTRISIRAVSGNATSGELNLNLYE